MTRPEDAGVDADQDAIIIDAAPDAWLPPDVFTPDSSEPDAFNVPGEGCNGLDDDFDGSVDEWSCGGEFVCIDGIQCGCPPNTFDCDSDIDLICEVRDATREHCGGCTPCDPSEDCSTEGGTPHCVIARITDFSAASVYRPNGTLLTDADIVLENAIIQVKTGNGHGLAGQMAATQTGTNLPVIGFGSTLRGSIVTEVERAGGLVTRDTELLLRVVAP